MFRSFHEIEDYISKGKFTKSIALAGSHDLDTLSSVVNARRKNIISAVLVGDITKTKSLLKKMDEPDDLYKFIEEPDSNKAAHCVCRLVAEGKADMPMKGKVMTADFMRAVLDKQYNFVPHGGIMSQATVAEYPEANRLLIISDCAVNINPDYSIKKIILASAVNLAHQLGVSCPKVAIITPVEVVNPAIPATIDAAMLAKDGDRGLFPGCIIDGPLALDNALDNDAAAAKNIGGPVAGNADILIMPDLCTGNVFTKSLHYIAHTRQSGNITGANIPVVMTSRTDTPDDKYYSILISVLQSLRQ